MPKTADLVLIPRWLVPIEPAGAFGGQAVALADGAILDVLPASQARERHPDAPTLELANHALMPGLVNLHTHAAMTLMRGMADDLPLMRWLESRIWPAEQRHISAEFVYDGTRLAAAEMLMGGITTAADMYFYPDAASRAWLDAGMRAVVGLVVLDAPTPYAGDAGAYLDRGLAARDAFKGEALLGFALAPHAPYTVSDATFRRIAILAGQLDLPIHTHLHETRDELAASLKQHGVRPLERLAGLGLLDPQFVAVHAVHLTDAEMATLAHHGCHVAHCPTSNLKLASGMAPTASLAAAGVNLGIGTDGAASNNRLDLFAETRLAALLAKAQSGDAGAWPAQTALEAATLGGARALGLDSLVGSIVPGKRADLVAVDLSAPACQPVFDPVSHLVYTAGREHVTHVWVEGKTKLDCGRLVGSDADDLVARAGWWRDRLSRSLGSAPA